MSRSATPLLLATGLALVAIAGPAAAQRTEVVTRTVPRSASSDTLAVRLRQLERSIDSLVREFGQDELSAEERFKIRRLIDDRFLEFMRLRAATPDLRNRDGNVFIRRIPEAGFEAGRKAVDAAMMPRVVQSALAPGWIGIVVTGAPTEFRVENNEMLLRYLLYPEIASVDPSSPAQRAGLAPGDTLLAYNGRDVRREEISMTRLLRPKSTVNVRVRREGRVREVPVVVAETPLRIRLRRDGEIREAAVPLVPMSTEPMIAGGGAAPFGSGEPARPTAPRSPGQMFGPQRVRSTLPPMFEPTPSGVVGAQMVGVSETMRRSLSLPAGVLVTSVPLGSPAAESGLQEGDVIVRVAQQSVTTVREIRELLQRVAEQGEVSVPLELRRGKDRRALTLRW